MTRAILIALPSAIAIAIAIAASAATVYCGNEGTRVLDTSDVPIVVRPPPADAPLHAWIAGRETRDGRAKLTVRFVDDAPGSYDLRDVLAAADGSPAPIDGETRVDVVSLDPAATTTSLAGVAAPRVAVAQTWRWGLLAATAAWAGGLVAWIASSRRAKPAAVATIAPEPTVDDASTLDALLAGLAEDGLDADQRRSLERLARRAAGQSFGYAPAGPMVTIERWQYRPESTGPDEVIAAVARRSAREGA